MLFFFYIQKEAEEVSCVWTIQSSCILCRFYWWPQNWKWFSFAWVRWVRIHPYKSLFMQMIQFKSTSTASLAIISDWMGMERTTLYCLELIIDVNHWRRERPFKKIKIKILLPIFRGKPVFIKENRRRMLRSWSNCRSRTYTLWMTFANDLFIYFIPVIFLWFINNWQDSAVLCETWFPWNGYYNPNLYWWNGNHFFVGFCFSGKDPNI